MTRVLVSLALGLTLLGGWCVRGADDPPKELTPEQRKELDARWKELRSALLQSYRAGKLSEAAETATKALETARRLYPTQDHPELALSLYNMAVVRKAQRRYADAESFHREALAMRRRLYDKQDHPELANSLNNLANVLGDQGKYADAEMFHREALAMMRRLYPNQDHPDLAASLNNLANVLLDQGRYADAETLHREALAMRRRLYDKRDHSAWRKLITEGKDIAPELPARVRELVWAKVRKQLPEQVKVVYLCPDLALCRVPWAALPGDKPGTVLLEDYALATVPHAVFLLDKAHPRLWAAFTLSGPGR
jgi:tetratricopeptide (TPR) repeat protein